MELITKKGYNMYKDGMNVGLSSKDIDNKNQRKLPQGWFGMIKIGPYHGIKKGEKELVRRNYKSGKGFNRVKEYWDCEAIGGKWNGNKLESKR